MPLGSSPIGLENFCMSRSAASQVVSFAAARKGMYVGLKQPRGDGERYVTPARAASKETTSQVFNQSFFNQSEAFACACHC